MDNKREADRVTEMMTNIGKLTHGWSNIWGMQSVPTSSEPMDFKVGMTLRRKQARNKGRREGSKEGRQHRSNLRKE